MAKDNIVKLDSRKLLGAMNDSAQAKIAFFEDRVRDLGKAAGKEWRLAALKANELYFEDVASGQYYLADHSKDARKVTITNIREIQVVDEEKNGIFGESCLKLIDAIEENDQRGMAAAFNRMKSQRFSSRAVPHSGFVRCQDRVLRRINVTNGNSFGEDVRGRLVSAIVEGLRDNVLVENGQVISGVFNDGEEIKLPVTKWAARKLVARRMMEAAKEAYWSQGFQKRIKNVASLVAESRIEEAVKMLTPFLEEMEEFTLLTRGQSQRLIENALAANAIFNNELCKDTATLFHRTNLTINRTKIIDEWRNIARKSEHPVLAENVMILSESKDFEAAYDKFLKLMFEAISNREVAAEALATTLEVLRNKTPKIRESHDLSSKLENLISRLKKTDFDDAAIYEAEDLIATIQEELSATETLGNFDQIPGAGGDTSLTGGDEGVAAPAGAGAVPPIVVNSPLIQIGGTSGGAPASPAAPPAAPPIPDPAAAGAEDPNADLGAEDPNAGGGDDELAALLGGGGLGESRKNRKSVNESRPNHYEMKSDDEDDSAEDDEDCANESSDPYALRPNEFKIVENSLLADYGAPVITDDRDLRKIVNVMHRLASENKLTGKALIENAGIMAKAGIKAVGLRIPAGRLSKAVEQLVSLYESELPFKGAAAPFGKKGKPAAKKSKPWDKDCDEDCDEEGVAEDQYHTPRIPARSYAKSAFKTDKKKGAKGNVKESITWGKSQNDSISGEYAGVRFLFDHGGDTELTPAILSEDGAVEIPIPSHLYNSAFAAANMAEDDATPFMEWLGSSIEQIRPISSEEDRALEEAMARITTGPDGTISVEVSDDIGVDGIGDDSEVDGDIEGDMDDAGGMIDDVAGDIGGDTDGMEPVDSIDTSESGEPESDDSDEMPDFEDESSMTDDSESEPDENRMPFEDKDITDPQSSNYTKHVKDNLRAVPDHKPTGKSDDKLEDIGPELKKDDGSGTNPPTAKK